MHLRILVARAPKIRRLRAVTRAVTDVQLPRRYPLRRRSECHADRTLPLCSQTRATRRR